MEFVYTSFGYGKVISDTESKLKVELDWGGVAYLQSDDICREITLLIKTFIGDRKTIE